MYKEVFAVLIILFLLLVFLFSSCKKDGKSLGLLEDLPIETQTNKEEIEDLENTESEEQIVEKTVDFSPEIISTINISGVNNIHFKDNYIYISSNEGSFYIIDVSNNKNPEIIGECNIPVNISKDFPSMFRIVEDYAYHIVFDGFFSIIDITDKSNPKVVGQLSEMGNIMNFKIKDDFAYFAAERLFDIVDISDKTNPKKISTIQPPKEDWWIIDLDIDNSFAYLSYTKNNFELPPKDLFQVVDITDALNPLIVGECEASVGNVFLEEGNAILTSSELVGLQIIDILNKEMPEVISTVDIGWNIFTDQYFYNNILYGTCISTDMLNDEGEFLLIDYSDVNNPFILENIQNFDFPNKVKIKDDFAYVVDKKGLKIIDCRELDNPVLVSECITSESANGNGQDRDFCINGDFVYIVDGQNLYIIDLFREPQQVANNGVEEKIDDTSKSESQKLEITSIKISPESITDEEFQQNYENIRIVAQVEINNPNNDSITYNYQWYKNDDIIEGATLPELPAELMGRKGHTIRGYEYKLIINATNNNGITASGEATIVVGGPEFHKNIEGILIHNLFIYNFDGRESLDSITSMKKKTNVSWASIGRVYFQQNINSSNIYEKLSESWNEFSTVPNDNLIAQINYVHSLGLKVMLYPEIWMEGQVVGPRDQIPGTDEWFENYKSKMVELADIAQNTGVELLCIGVELRETVNKEQQWRSLIAEVRNHYSGKITFSIHWDSAHYIKWWDAVDYIGVSCNFETRTGNSDPTVDELVSIYSNFRNNYYNLSKAYNKPLLITECGVPSADGGTIMGSEASGIPDFQEHADYYNAVFKVFYDQPWVSGIFVHDWFPATEGFIHSGGEPTHSWEIGSEIKDKCAERVIKSWYKPN